MIANMSMKMNRFDSSDSSDSEYVDDRAVKREVKREVKRQLRRRKPIVDSSSDDSDSRKSRKRYPKTHILKPKRSDERLVSFEYFNYDALAYILAHRDELKIAEYDVKESAARKRYLEQTFGKDYDGFKMSEKYFNKAILMNADEGFGSIKVSYLRRKGIARAHAIGGLSQQGLPVEIRHTIAKDYYNDVDMVNAHPVILLHLCKMRGLETPVLSRYVNDRESILAEVCEVAGIKRGLAKIIFLCLLNGGTRDYTQLSKKPSVLTAFLKEMLVVHKDFTKDRMYAAHVKTLEKRGKTFNQAASYMNVLLCDVEHQLLMSIKDGIYDLAEQQGIVDDETGLPNIESLVYVFDGLQVLKKIELDLPMLEKHVFKAHGIAIKLSVKPMDLGYKLPSPLPKYIKPEYKIPNSFDYDDKYSYRDLYNEFRESKWESRAKMDAAIKTKYPRVIAKVLSGEGFFIKKGKDGVYSMVKKLGVSDFTMYYLDDNNREKKERFQSFLGRQDGFDDVECKLGLSDGSNFNIWSGFSAKRCEGTTEGCERMKKFILEVWANSDPKLYTYIMSWIAGLFTNLEGINRTALAVVSKPGCGKNFLTNFISEMLRTINAKEVVGVKPITIKHNSILVNKRLVVVNEMSSTRAEFKSSFDKMKALITDPTIHIDPKGLKPYSVDNIGNFILCTNHIDSIVVEECDRRYTILEISDRYRGNTSFFKELVALAYNQETYNAFYTYLLDFKAVDVSKPIVTKAKKEMVQLSKSPSIRFIDNYRESLDEQVCIKASILYQTFRIWCDENGERLCTNAKFGLSIRENIEKKRKRAGMFYIVKPLSESQG